MLFANMILYRAVALWLLVRAVNPPENRRVRVDRIGSYLANAKPVSSAFVGLDSTLQQFRVKMIGT